MRVIALLALLAFFVGLRLLYSLTDHVFAGTMSVGDLGVIFVFFGQFVAHAWNVGQLWIFLQDNVVGLRLVRAVAAGRPGEGEGGRR